MKNILWPVLLIYFVISWFVPWYKIPTEISISYIFDVLFIITLIISFKIKFIAKSHFEKDFFLSLIMTVVLAFISILIVGVFNLSTPFHLVENMAWHLLIFAPFIEEFLFRVSFGSIAKLTFSKKKSILVTSSCFSLSHLPAIWFLPAIFHPFIYVQLIYTFILGFILSSEFFRRLSVSSVIILHFIFNLIFYLSLKSELI